MQPVIIADASCLILLDKIGELRLLQMMYDRIVITKIVEDEFGMPLPEWISVQNPNDISKQHILEFSVDRGEASAIALALEKDDCLLIIDDLPGRTLAKRLKLTVTGTLGILADAKLNGIIPSVKPVLEKIRQTNFRISEQLVEVILRKANE